MVHSRAEGVRANPSLANILLSLNPSMFHETPANPEWDDAAQERAQLAVDWERARTAVFAQLLAGIGSFHDAEDVLQEVAVSVAKNYSSYDSTRPFVAWCWE